MYILLIVMGLVGESATKFNEWNSWSPCTVTCGSGMRSRERISKFEKCYSELSERKVCINDPCVEHGNLTNVALDAYVTASSVFLAAFPSRNIVDGDESTDFYSGTCTETNKDDEPWFRIELNGTAMIKEVVVFNRGDCCSERLNQMEVTVGEDPYGYNNTLCGRRGVMEGVKMARVPCYESTKGSYIHVRIPGPQYLALCEVKVYGRFIHQRELENIAVGKGASQSSTRPGNGAELAVDGDLNTYSYADTSIAWWRVDLGKSAIIYKVRVYPGDFVYVANTTVTIGMTSCGMFSRDGGQQRRQGYWAYDVTCETPLVGRYIQTNKNSENGYHLSMNEFEAYGRYI